MGTIISILLLAFGLAIDAMVAATTIGLCKLDLKRSDGIRTGIYFGLFQAVMPLLGYLLGYQFRQYVQPFDHWIILALLGLIGCNMIREGREAFDPHTCPADPCSHRRLLLLALATSIDALAAGISLSLTDLPMVASIIVIGAVTFSLSYFGVVFGKRVGRKFRSVATLIGGTVLILIGIKIVIEHLINGI